LRLVLVLMKQFEKYSKYHVNFYTGEVRPLLDKYIKSVPWQSFLDVGCGDGALLYAMKTNGYMKDKDVHAVDLSKERIQRAKRVDDKFKCFVDDAESLKTVSSESIDLLVSVNVAEHVDDVKMIKAIHRVLKNGGVAYLSTTFKKWYGWYFYRSKGKWVLDPTHLREYTDDNQLLGLLVKNGFTVLETTKSVSSYPIIEIFSRVLRLSGQASKNPLFRLARKVRVPIVGYYKWEIVCQKKAG